MERCNPTVMVLAETMGDLDGVKRYLEHAGAPDWTTDCPTDSEGTIELAGRACYRSYAPGLNPNVEKVREGNATYLANIIRQGHGSVLEHAVATFAFCDVSRVFTHELVRHRVGTGISQESLRYVRTTDLKYMVPAVIQNDVEALRLFEESFARTEELYQKLTDHFTAKDRGDFHFKKQWTSAIRRILPQGMGTTIIWSANMRTMRHVIEARTDPGAEEEVRYIFGLVAEIARKRWPNLFADYTVTTVDGLPWYQTENRKV